MEKIFYIYHILISFRLLTKYVRLERLKTIKKISKMIVQLSFTNEGKGFPENYVAVIWNK